MWVEEPSRPCSGHREAKRVDSDHAWDLEAVVLAASVEGLAVLDGEVDRPAVAIRPPDVRHAAGGASAGISGAEVRMRQAPTRQPAREKGQPSTTENRNKGFRLVAPVSHSAVVIVCGREAKAPPQAKNTQVCQDGAVKRPGTNLLPKVLHDEARHRATAMSSHTRVRQGRPLSSWR